MDLKMINFVVLKSKRFICVHLCSSVAKFCLVVLGSGFFLSLSAGSWADTTASWLDIPSGAKQAAFSGSLGALVDDVEALRVNPAGLADLSGDQVIALHNQWAQNLTMEHFAYGHGFGTSGIALGGDYINFGQVALYDLSPLGAPQANGTFSPLGMDFYAGAGLEVAPGLSLGAEGKILFQSLVSGTTSSAEAIDLGILYRHRPTGLSGGLALLNLGTTLDGADLPLALHLSAAYQTELAVGHEIALGADGGLALNDKNGSTVSVGAEYLYQGLAALRVGYRLISSGQLGGLSGLSAGVGLNLGPTEWSYALTTLGELGVGHQVSLSYRFGSAGQRPLTAPTGLVKGWEDGKIILSWDPAREVGVAGYNFYLKKPKDQTFKKVNARPLQDNTVTLEHIKNGVTYQFGITTVTRDGRESSMSTLTMEPQ